MATTTFGFRRLSPFFTLAGLLLTYFGANPERLWAQSEGAQANPPIIRSTGSQFSTIVLGPISPSPAPLAPQVGRSGSGLTIVPTFDSSIDVTTRTVISNAIAFYQNTFTNNITVHIFFYSMSTGLGQSVTVVYTVPYAMYCSDLTSSSTSADDSTALLHTPCGANNPVTNSANILVKPPNGMAVGLNTPEVPISVGGTPCQNFTGSGCIGLNVTLANMHSALLATVEHEIDEVLGLGSALQGTTTPGDPWTEDLFRWASAGTRSFATNTSTTNPCANGTPAAFFSIDGGTTDLNQFNNCNNGGDYGDWTTHTPSQVQDAFTNFSASPSLTVTSTEVRALDVIGYSVVSSKHRRGQLTSE